MSNATLREALSELVRLKDLKDEESRLRQRRLVSITRDIEAVANVNEMRDTYNRRAPLAWDAARAALAADDAARGAPRAAYEAFCAEWQASRAAAPQADEPCFCDRTGLGAPGVSCGDCPTRDYKKHPAPQSVEPVMWQYRWTNPGDYPSQSSDALEWKEVRPRADLSQTLEEKLDELRAYRYGGKPCYEVRPLYLAPPTAPTDAEWQEEAMRLHQACMTKYHSAITASDWSLMNARMPAVEEGARRLRTHIATRPQEDGWIACSERLPEPGIDVLCYRRGEWSDPPPIVAGMHKGEWFVHGDDSAIVCITHWRPLPAPPTKTKENGE